MCRARGRANITATVHTIDTLDPGVARRETLLVEGFSMAATATELTLSLVASALSRPILEGEVTPRDIKLRAQPAESIDNVSRRMVNVEYDIGEMSFATFILARRTGVPVIGLPFFTSGRNFQQRTFTLAPHTQIDDLSGLRGRRVGTPQYWLSTSVWQRWILEEIHGVAPTEIEWVTTDPERFELVPFPPGVHVRRDTTGRSIREMMQAGDLDASLATPGVPQVPGETRRPAYPDPLAAQRAFYERTGIFPTNHIVVIKEDVVRDDPWVIESLGEAFVSACRSQGAWDGPLSVEDLFPASLPATLR